MFTPRRSKLYAFSLCSSCAHSSFVFKCILEFYFGLHLRLHVCAQYYAPCGIIKRLNCVTECTETKNATEWCNMNGCLCVSYLNAFERMREMCVYAAQTINFRALVIWLECIGLWVYLRRYFMCTEWERELNSTLACRLANGICFNYSEIFGVIMHLITCYRHQSTWTLLFSQNCLQFFDWRTAHLLVISYDYRLRSALLFSIELITIW